jgi:hypothetical protein
MKNRPLPPFLRRQGFYVQSVILVVVNLVQLFVGDVKCGFVGFQHVRAEEFRQTIVSFGKAGAIVEFPLRYV